MDVKQAIETRRAYRSLAPVEITDDTVNELCRAASLTPTCFNMQPARLVFVRESGTLKKLHDALGKNNDWARAASMIVAVCSKKELGCLVENKREYYLYDSGTTVGFLVLRATELGLVAHPIAGYAEKAVKDALSIPEDMTVITLVIVGKHTDSIGPLLTEKQAASEKERPERFPYEKVFFRDKFQPDP